MRIAIIPARGGSKRVPRKNVIELGKQPMLTYSIQCALESDIFDDVYVSTEDAEIAEIARQWGAAVIDRPQELATDESTVAQVCAHALDALAQRSIQIEIFCCIYATAAFITPADLSASLAMVDEEPKADVVMGVSTYDIHPVKALTRNGGYWKRMWPEYEGQKSQNYPYLVASNGTLYWARAAAFRAQQKFYVERLKCFEIPSSRAVDIDTPEDLKRARHLMDNLQAKAES